MIFMEIKDRIQLIMKKENIKSGTFADNIGIQQSTFSHVINGKRKASLEVVMKIHQCYHYINLDWLLYGKGEMIIGEEPKHFVNDSAHTTTFKTSTSKQSEFYPSLFDENAENTTEDPEQSKNRKEMAVEKPINDIKRTETQSVKYIKLPPRKITEIRIFFDDNTYETFTPEK